MEPEDRTQEEVNSLVEELRQKISAIRVYMEENPDFLESIKTMQVEYDKNDHILYVSRENRPELAMVIDLNEDALEYFGEEGYYRLLGMTAAYEYDTQINLLYDPRINAPFPSSLQ